MASTNKKTKLENKFYIIFNGEAVPIGISCGRGKKEALGKFYQEVDVEPSVVHYAEPMDLSENGVCAFSTVI